MKNDRGVLTSAMRADVERQPVMTQAEAHAAWARVQMDIVAAEPGLALVLWGGEGLSAREPFAGAA